jgi:NAD(P)-dependent dehydrogenase (short-subunit alcohol dehydrogenase family)
MGWDGVRLADKVAVVTGGGFRHHGRVGEGGVRVADIRDPHQSRAALGPDRRGAGQGAPALVRVSDVGDPDTSLADAAVVAEAFGGIDIVVTAAGFS